MTREFAPAGCRLFLVLGIREKARPAQIRRCGCREIRESTGGDDAASMRAVAELLGRPAPEGLEAAGRVHGLCGRGRWRSSMSEKNARR